jgi:hypothetical protein
MGWRVTKTPQLIELDEEFHELHATTDAVLVGYCHLDGSHALRAVLTLMRLGEVGSAELKAFLDFPVFVLAGSCISHAKTTSPRT